MVKCKRIKLLIHVAESNLFVIFKWYQRLYITFQRISWYSISTPSKIFSGKEINFFITSININIYMISIYTKGLWCILGMIHLHSLEIRLLMSNIISMNDCRNQYFQRNTSKKVQNTWIRLLCGWIRFLIGITMGILYIWFVFWWFIPFNTKLISNWIKKKWISSLYHVFIFLTISHSSFSL